jgi:hypothetical protein
VADPAPAEILALAAADARGDLSKRRVDDDIATSIEYVCRNIQNRAPIRALLSCALAKVHRPTNDVRMPYTEIGTAGAFSGRSYDEQFLGPFINENQLPCNSTTAYLTPAFRNRNIVLTPDVNLVGRPPDLYQAFLGLLSAIHEGRVDARSVLVETLRVLLILKAEREQRMATMLAGLKTTQGASVPLSAENILILIKQHLACKGTSRLPVLIVAAAYTAAERNLGERAKTLQPHTAADVATGALGDIEITLLNGDQVVTSYEMKMKRVTREDIDHALAKITNADVRVDNYIFITTEAIEQDLAEYAATLYDQTGGIEFAILDCIGFLRHFLHLFHRLRQDFLDWYQEFLLAEPESAVRQELKEAFLALRQAVESSPAAD